MANPFNTTFITSGKYSPSHQSSASIVYLPQTLLTPWPITVVGLAISLIIVAWGVYRKFRDATRHWSEALKPSSLWGSLLAFGITTIRALAAFVQTIRAIYGGHTSFPNALSVFSILAPLWWYLNQDFFERVNVGIIMSLNIASFIDCVFLISSMALLFQQVVMKKSYSAKWALIGGNCPLLVDSCQQLQFVGCGLDNITGPGRVNMKDINSANPGRSIQLGMPAIAFVAFLAMTYQFLFWNNWEAGSGRNNELYRPQVYDRAAQKSAFKSKRFMLLAQIASSLLTLLNSGVALWNFISQETNPDNLFVIDGYGPVVPLLPGQNYTGIHGTSWTDCFEIRAPSDKYGFLHFWWNEHRPGVDELLSLS